MLIDLKIEEWIRPITLVRGKELDSIEKLRNAFVKDYTPGKICRLKLKEYAIGYGPENRSFCYRLERELIGLGSILGSTAPKFGIYWSKKNNAPNFHSKWGGSGDAVLSKVLSAIEELIEAGHALDLDAIQKNPLTPVFRGKILNTYFPETFAPIYSEDHLRHFVKTLNLKGKLETTTAMQMALMKFRKNHPVLKQYPPVVTMWFLYDTCHPELEAAETEAAEVILDQATENLRELAALPVSHEKTPSGTSGKRPGKFKNDDGRQKAIGDRGELLIFEREKKRLMAAGKHDLAGQVKHVAASDDSAGYDILSFETDGTERPIEVKATTGASMAGGFFISANEVRVAQEKPNYHLFLVFSAMSANPAFFSIKAPDFRHPSFTLEPLQFRVRLSPATEKIAPSD